MQRTHHSPHPPLTPLPLSRSLAASDGSEIAANGANAVRTGGRRRADTIELWGLERAAAARIGDNPREWRIEWPEQ